MKKSLIAGLLVLTLLLSFTACSNSGENKPSENSGSSVTQTAQLEKTSFHLGYLNSTAHLLAFVAQEEGYFEEEGLNVTLTQFSSAAELSAGLEIGRAHV